MCETDTCNSEACVQLTQNLLKPTWFCTYCAEKTLRATGNGKSFLTIKQQSLIDYKAKSKSDPKF